MSALAWLRTRFTSTEGVRWRTVGRHVSWFLGRPRVDSESPCFVRVFRLGPGRGWHQIRVRVFDLRLWVDRRGHTIEHEPDPVRRWITGRPA